MDVTQVTFNGLNLYAYCLNNPVNEVDENGNLPKWLSWILKALAVVGAIALTLTLAVFTAGAGLGALGAVLTAGFVGAAGSLTGQLISDIGTSIATRSWYMSSFNEYLGAAIGGFAGGVTLALTGSTTLSFGVASGVSTTSTSLLNGESVASSLVKGLGSFMIGAVMGKFLGGTKVTGITKGIGSFLSVFKAGLTKMLKYTFNMTANVVLKGFLSMVTYKLTSNIISGIFQGLDFQRIIGTDK